MDTNSSRRRPIFVLGTILVVVLILFFSSLFYLLLYYLTDIFTAVVIFLTLVSIATIVGIARDAQVHSKIANSSIIPLCHDLVGELSLCPRCKGFYVGLIVFGVLMALRRTLFSDLFRYIGFPAYVTLIALVLLVVLSHVTLRRMKHIDGQSLLNITGFLFSMVIFMIGSLIAITLWNL